MILKNDKNKSAKISICKPFGFGPTTTDLLVAQFITYGEDNKGIGTVSTFSILSTETNSSFRTYIRPKQGEFNQTYAGYHTWILNKDGDKSLYKTVNSSNVPAYGAFFGFHAASVYNGIFFTDSGLSVLATYREDRSDKTAFENPDERNVTASTEGTLRIEDEQKGYAAGEACTNPGVIAFDSADNNFLGCVELYDGNTKTGEMVWKKLNNN